MIKFFGTNKKTAFAVVAAALSFVLLGSVVTYPGVNASLWHWVAYPDGKSMPPHGKAKNIILMVPDGMNLDDVTATRIIQNGIGGPPLHLETLKQIGYQRTYSADATVTDSAAAGSTWACGDKFNNGLICWYEDGTTKPSILDLAKAKGMSTALVATSTITHATPAAFGASVPDRGCENEIARQYVEETQPDVLLGGGKLKFSSTEPDPCGVSGDFITTAQGEGYSVVYTKAELDAAVASGDTKVLGLFNDGGMPPEIYGTPSTREPSLPEMTKAALDILEKNPKGFFAMIEGSQVDWANHANDLNWKIGEVLDFDESVKVVLDWINASPNRNNNTLLIVVSDHGVGGFSINSANGGLGEFEDGWTTDDHTGVDTIIWSQGPGSKALGRAMDNTDLYTVMKQAGGL